MEQTTNTNNELQWTKGAAGPFALADVASNNGFKYWYYRVGHSDQCELTIEFGDCRVCRMHGLFANESTARTIANKHNSMVSKNIQPQNTEFNCPPIAQQNQKKMLGALDEQRALGIDKLADTPITKEKLDECVRFLQSLAYNWS